MEIKTVLAKGISFVFHPLLLPTYLLLMIFQMSLPEVLAVSLKYKMLLLVFIFSMTFLLPVLLMLILWSMKLIKHFQMQSQIERIISLAAMFVFYFFTFYALRQLPVFPYYNLFLEGSAILVLLAIVINYYYKISLHMVAWGGFTAALTGMSFQFHEALYFYLFIAIILSGIVGFSRLQCKAHSSLQVYLGYLLGFAEMLFLFFIQSS